MGRLVFTDDGAVSGYSSVNFAGFFLGNPISGNYEIQEDCSLSWNLQDGSGAQQHFQGVATPDAKKVQFRQTDPGGPARGIMAKTAEDCTTDDFRNRYKLTIGGSTFAMEQPAKAERVFVEGVLETDESGDFTLIPPAGSNTTGSGSFVMEDGCFVHLELALSTNGVNQPTMTFRGILVDSGSQIFGIETDPGAAVIVKLVAP